MPLRTETSTPPVSELVSGEFRRNSSYTNWRPRGTNDWLLIYTEAGAGLISTPAGTAPTRPGDIILYAPGDLHDYRTDPEQNKWHLLWVHFLPKPSWHPWLQLPPGPHGVRSFHLENGEVREGFAGAMRRLLRFSRRKLPAARDFALNALEEALLWAHVAAAREPGMQTDPRVQKAMDYLTANLRQPFLLETLARHCGLSVSRLAHVFKAETGLSPQQFFEQQRMEYARQLLRLTGLGIAEVAVEVGYEDPFYFSNRFRRFAEKSPTQFRQGQKVA